MTTPSNHHVSVFSNTRFPHEAPYRIFCATCGIRRGFFTQEEAKWAAEYHRQAHPYQMSEETFRQRKALITNALTGMNPDQLQIVQDQVADLITAGEEEQ